MPITDLRKYDGVGGLELIDTREQLITMNDLPPAGGSIRAVPVKWRACGVGENVTNAEGVTQQMSNPDDPAYVNVPMTAD